MEPDSLEGGCLCGRVRFRVTGELLAFQYCHCSRCRRLTGSAHAANLFTELGGVEWVAGESDVTTFMLDAEPKFPTAFCSTCGCSMPVRSSTGKAWIVPAGSLESDPGLRPARSIFYGNRAPWFIDVGGLPRHDAWPDGGAPAGSKG